MVDRCIACGGIEDFHRFIVATLGPAIQHPRKNILHNICSYLFIMDTAYGSIFEAFAVIIKHKR
jgi:hypothetical protein